MGRFEAKRHQNPMLWNLRKAVNPEIERGSACKVRRASAIRLGSSEQTAVSALAFGQSQVYIM